MKKKMLLTLWSIMIVHLISFVGHVNASPKEDVMKIVKGFMPANASLVSPENPIATQAIQLYDFNHDGEKEIIFTFEKKAKEQPSLFGAIALEKDNEDWRKVWETKTRGVALDFSGLVDITGNGTKEYLFSVTIGAAMGSELEVFQWSDNTFEKIATVPYHKMDFVNGNKKVGIAVWQMYIGDSYLVDVLKWNGEKLVYDEELYAKYYPVIEKFYHKKIAEMDAWFYWYCLADAQIKANKLEEATKSIQKGISLAKKSSLQDVIQDFNDLTQKLGDKRN